MEKAAIQHQLKELISQYFREDQKEPFVQGKTRIPLNVASYGAEEVSEALDSLLTTWVTMGKKVKEFESLFANYIGTKYAIMVNSGSSANLLAMSIITNPALGDHLQPGDEVITPAVTWATTVFPIINAGLMPVLVDVEPETYNIDPGEIERAISPKSKAILPVHLLGNPCPMDEIRAIADRHGLMVIEDTCEAHGAELIKRKVGGFGLMSTFSFFFTHHISTIEGGMLLTNNEEVAELARAMRVFGWIRDMQGRDSIARQYPQIDPRFLFWNIGYNLRPMEIQGAFGIHQMKKLDQFIEIRRSNARYWSDRLSEFSDYLVLPEERAGTRHVWFGYPITVRAGAPFSRGELVSFLESRGLETRPIMSGNIDEQPAMSHFPSRKVGTLPNARAIMRQSFFFGNHQGVGEEERAAVVEYFKEFMSGQGAR